MPGVSEHSQTGSKVFSFVDSSRAADRVASSAWLFDSLSACGSFGTRLRLSGRLQFVPARGPPAAGRNQQTLSRHLHRAEDSRPRFRHAPVAAASQVKALSQHLNFPRQAGSALGFRFRLFGWRDRTEFESNPPTNFSTRLKPRRLALGEQWNTGCS
jgi:hypothetical protein